MKQYTLLTIGKVKEAFCKQGIEEYAKRIKQFETISLKDSTKEKEGDTILEHLAKHTYDYIIALDEHGKNLTSVEFSELLTDKQTEKICFIIGGPDGITKEVLLKANMVLRLSNMTFTHEMAHLFFVEQLYRAQSIQDGKNYHRV